MLTHSSASIRIHALSLLSRSKSPKAPLSQDGLLSLQSNIAHFHTEVDPKTRNEFIALAKRLFSRVRTVLVAQDDTIRPYHTSYKVMKSEEHNSLEHKSLQGTQFIADMSSIEHHASFLRWYLSFLAQELQPTASYQRHIIALDILQSALRDYTAQCSLVSSGLAVLDKFVDRLGASYTEGLCRLLFDLIMDSFDDVRSLATSILLFIRGGPLHRQIEMSTANPVNELTTVKPSLVVSRAEKVMRATCRADHADGLARLNLLTWQLAAPIENGYETKSALLEVLISGLEADLEKAHSSLRFAVANAPLHGRIIALR